MYEGYSKSSFLRILKNCVENNFFIFDGKVYEQVDGCPMGGCVSPTMASTFLCFHEDKWLQKCPNSYKPVLYRRYVDDCFLLFRHESHIEKFHKFLNQQHERIEFTVELEVSNKLPFLDTCVIKCGNFFRTVSYRKPTNTGLGMKYHSAVSFDYKMNLIDCLVHRAFKINTTLQGLMDELNFLRNLFVQNGYNALMVMKKISKKLESLNNPSPAISTAAKKIVYCKIPFMSNNDNKNFKKGLLNLIHEYFPHVNLRLIFSNSFTVGRLFPYKDRIPVSVRSNVVYKYTCGSCQATYIGESSRHYRTRVSEHCGISPRTGLRLTKPNSNIYKHFEEKDHEILRENFSIMSYHSPWELKVAESIAIHEIKPNLNGTVASVELNILA